jgi:outer membrane lipoprotein SlyB
MRKLLTAMSVAVLTACATSSPHVVHPYETQRVSHVFDATVLSVRPVTIDGTQSGLGATAGAVAGGVAGAQVGGYNESFVFSVVGAILGGVVGNAMERGATQRNGVEIVVQLRNGERRAIVQAIGAETYAPGDAVVLVSTGGRARISHAPMPAAAGAATVPPAPAAARAPAGIPVPAAYPDAPVQPVYPSGPVPPRT